VIEAAWAALGALVDRSSCRCPSGRVDDRTLGALTGRMADKASPRRMRTWAFAALLLATFVASWFAYFRHAWWAWLALIAFALAAPYVRKRWTGPEWVERLNPRLERAMPRFWAGLGWLAVVFGWFFMVVAPIGLIVGLVNRDYSVVAGNAIALLFAYVFFLRGGRWLVRNRRQPFTPP
jgi:hypothetical protein